MKFILVLVLPLLLFGCASTSQIVENTHERNLSAGEARIYVLRPSVFSSAFKMTIYANDKFVGKIGPKAYLCWDVKEGEYILKSSAENVDLLTVNARPGKVYYIMQKAKPGALSVRTALEVIDDEKGRVVLSKLKAPKEKYID